MSSEVLLGLVTSGFILVAILIVVGVSMVETKEDTPPNKQSVENAIPITRWLQNISPQEQSRKYCLYCGTRWDDDDQFCAQCGAPNKYNDE